MCLVVTEAVRNSPSTDHLLSVETDFTSVDLLMI